LPKKVIWEMLGVWIILSMLFGCSIFPTDTEYSYYPMRPYSVLDIESGERRTPIVFRLSSSLNTPCNEFSHSDIVQNYHDILVRFFQREEKDIHCTQVGVDTVITWGYIPLSAGQYRFHFWQSDSTSLDTTVLIR